MDKNKIAVHLAKQVASVQATAPADLEALKARALAVQRLPDTVQPYVSGGTQVVVATHSLTGVQLDEVAGFYDAASPAVVLALIDRIARAERALVGGGFVDHGAQEWKPPIGPAPRFIEVPADAALEALRVGQQAVPEGWTVTFRAHGTDNKWCAIEDAGGARSISEEDEPTLYRFFRALLHEKAAPAAEIEHLTDMVVGARYALRSISSGNADPIKTATESLAVLALLEDKFAAGAARQGGDTKPGSAESVSSGAPSAEDVREGGDNA